MAARWTCPGCRATLGDIREGALVIRPGTRVLMPAAGATIEVTCRCGRVKLWFGRRVIVTADNRARL